MVITSTSTNHVRVGVGVLVKDPLAPNKIFAGIRKGSHGEGCLALPGGHLEMYESWSDCASREVTEETGLLVHNTNFVHTTNDLMIEEGKHYVTIFMTATCTDNSTRKPENREPEKCEGWESFDWNELGDIAAGRRTDLTMFGPLRQMIQDRPVQVMDFLGAQ